MLLVFALTLFTSATLLFLVQPMVGKMITPLLGGTPAVWNTCMVFFQALLLGGYAYAHVATAWLGARKQAVLHLLVLLTPLAFFPLAVDRAKALTADQDPVLTVLLLLMLSVGVPFLVVSTSAPLLQKWFASTDHPAAKDPYFLYGASNFGSMLALLGYPTVVEPWLSLVDQRFLWCIGYGVLALLVGACAVGLWWSAPAREPSGEAPPPVGAEPSLPVPPEAFAKRPMPRRVRDSRVAKGKPPAKQPSPPPQPALDGHVTALRRLRWVLLAAVPSSLMLGATTYMTTDIAAIPLLWVLPLTLYLLSFIIVFSNLAPRAQAVVVWVMLTGVLGAIAWLVPSFFNKEQLTAAGWIVRAACAVAALLGLSLVKVSDARILHRVCVLAMPLLILLLMFVMLSTGGRPDNIVFALLLHLATLFGVAMVCHGELASDRPAPRHLTEFFLWMSVGGVVGGMFNALIAPLVFNGIVEYQLAMVVACFLVPPLTAPGKEAGWNLTADLILGGLFVAIGALLVTLRLRDENLELSILGGWTGVLVLAALAAGAAVAAVNLLRGKQRSPAAYLDAILPLALILLVAGLYWGLTSRTVWPRVLTFATKLHIGEKRLWGVLTFGVPAVLCYTFIERPVRFGLSVGALALATAACGLVEYHPEFQKRSFFGVLKVESDTKVLASGNLRTDVTLMHGTTWHGTQHRCPTDKELDLDWRTEPLSYYHHTGPVGHVFDRYNTDPKRPFGVIGLGTGTMACYALKGQHVTFYDIDPVVRGISFDTDKYFTYVSDARDRGAALELVMGDARLTMERQQLTDDEKYGLLVVDAFSSDAIPVHLITWQALQLYLDRMRPDGIVLFHISNRYLNLQPVLANFVQKGDLAAYVFNDDEDEDKMPAGKARSTWVAIARQPEHLDRLKSDPAWEKMRPTLLAATFMVGHVRMNGPWKELKPDPKVGVWTDDYSNLLSVFDWGH
jgi:hypothetical protein